jgi:serine/threonine-protein kinase
VFGVASRAFIAGSIINDRYTIVRKLGSYGDVYEARDGNLNDKPVAVKFLFPDAAGVVKPWDEARHLERLRSRFLVDVINADVVWESDIRFIVTPLLSSDDLESAAAELGLSVQTAARYMQQVVTGIDRIHADTMIHRDIKPGNVLLGDDGVFVIDLEYCELLDQDGRTPPKGTFCSVAPEVLGDCGYCSVRSDVYSLAATAFYLLSGVYPVDHKLDKAEQARRIAAGEIRELRQVAPHISQAVGTVIRKGLSFDPAKRFDTALSFGNALTQAARSSRDWRRVKHDNHVHCMEGSAAKSKAAVAICVFPSGADYRVQSRLQRSNRRVANVPDVTVRARDLARTLQQLVKKLG